MIVQFKPSALEAESRQPETSECRSGGIEGRGFLAAPRSRQTRFLSSPRRARI